MLNSSPLCHTLLQNVHFSTIILQKLQFHGILSAKISMTLGKTEKTYTVTLT